MIYFTNVRKNPKGELLEQYLLVNRIERRGQNQTKTVSALMLKIN